MYIIGIQCSASGVELASCSQTWAHSGRKKLLKNGIWMTPLALLPVVCGTPCESQRSRTLDDIFFETGFRPETGIAPAMPAQIEAIQFGCDATQGNWWYTVDISGVVDQVTMSPKYSFEDVLIDAESHGMAWGFHPTEAEWSRFSLSLKYVETPEAWVDGSLTAIPCGTGYPGVTWLMDVIGGASDTGLADTCVVWGENAEELLMENPSCTLWET